MGASPAYTISRGSNGSYTITGPKVRRQGIYVPSDERLKERYERELKENGRMSSSLRGFLSWRGFIESGKRCMAEGRKAIGINPATIMTKDGEVERRTSWREVEEAIDSAYPLDKVKAFMGGEDIELPMISEFRVKNHRVYHSVHRTAEGGNGFRALLEKLRPGLYDKLTRAWPLGRELDEKEMSKILVERFNTGQTIGKVALLTSDDDEERRLARDILVLASRRKMNYYDAIEKLAGLSKKEVEMNQGAAQTYGRIGESLVHFLLMWGAITGVEMNRLIPPVVPDPKTEDRISYIYGVDKEGLADLRIGNHAIEVKCGRQRILPRDEIELVEKYGQNNGQWVSGEPVEGSILFLNKPDSTYEHAAERLRKAGIEVIGQNWINSKLKEVVKRMGRDFKKSTKDLVPRLDLEQISQLADQISFRPDTLLRKANMDLSTWSSAMLTALIERGYELLQ